ELYVMPRLCPYATQRHGYRCENEHYGERHHQLYKCDPRLLHRTLTISVAGRGVAPITWSWPSVISTWSVATPGALATNCMAINLPYSATGLFGRACFSSTWPDPVVELDERSPLTSARLCSS